ncbi:MAG: hypothetical protein OXU61_08925 [Gammaproteobacteria bacterium]|nr:hypothetical protein [Gammaproteobacteria bacterium]
MSRHFPMQCRLRHEPGRICASPPHGAKSSRQASIMTLLARQCGSLPGGGESGHERG